MSFIENGVLKKEKNEEMLDDYLKLTHELVVNKLNLELPSIN